MTTDQAVTGFLETARARVDAALVSFLPSPPTCPALLSEAMRYSVMAGGKRLRPILVLAAADAVARRAQAGRSVRLQADLESRADAGHYDEDVMTLALPAACAVEFIHTYSLIHDDLPSMDNDTLRRGRPTLHVVYGDGVAILAGDALQAEAFALLAREPVSGNPEIAGRKLAAIRAIADAAGAVGMVGGQAIDLQAAGLVAGHALTLAADDLQDMHLRKTGALIRASALSGAIMAGADRVSIDAVGRWGREVGLAFQIVDDILDVEGDDAVLGKTAGKDAASAKPTYPSAFGLSRAKAMAAECAERAHDVLAGAHLTDGWLNAMADWVITRTN